MPANDKTTRPYADGPLAYFLTVLALAAGTISLFAWQTSAPVATFVLVVIVTTSFFGTRPGLFATVAAVPVLVYVLPPGDSWRIDPSQFMRLGYFLVIAGFIVWIITSERRSAASLRRARDELQRHNEALTRENVEGEARHQLLRQSEEDLRLVIDTIPTMAWILLPNGKMEFLNRRWLDFAGMSLDQAITDAYSIMHPEDVSRARQQWGECMASGKPFEDELRLRGADGQYRWFLVRTVALRDENGEVRRWYGTSADIDDRKRAEQSLRENAERLQQLSHRLLQVHEDERRHFSRELHDEFGQLLIAINLHLHAGMKLAGEAARPDLENAAAVLQESVDRVRGLALELRPAILETAGLAMTLRWLATQQRQRTGLATEVVGDLGDDIPSDVAIACFRIAQEALNNAARHARARHVWIEIAQKDGSMRMTIRDDGRGFDVASTTKTAPGTGHLGLLGIKERVEILGGEVTIESFPKVGTRISVSVPLKVAELEMAGKGG